VTNCARVGSARERLAVGITPQLKEQRGPDYLEGRVKQWSRVGTWKTQADARKKRKRAGIVPSDFFFAGR
jgi:hypothetical protein